MVSSSFDDRGVVCIYDYSGWANVVVLRTSSHKAVQYLPVIREHVAWY